MSNCFAEAFGYDKNHRQRGNDEPDAPLLVEGDDSANDVAVVIGAVESNEADPQAADQLDAALGVKSKEPGTALLFGFWRNLIVLAGTRGDRRTFGITPSPPAHAPRGWPADALRSGSFQQLVVLGVGADPNPQQHVW